MEKPRKKEWYYPELSKPNETEKRYIQGKIDSWNECHDDMSTWIWGEIPKLADDIFIYLNSVQEYRSERKNNYTMKGEAYQAMISKPEIADAIKALLTQRLGGRC